MAGVNYSNLTEVKCKYCGICFKNDRRTNRTRKYCSLDCHKKSNIKLDKYSKCDCCGKYYYRKISSIKLNYFYCSHTCRKSLSLLKIKLEKEIKALKKIKNYKEKVFKRQSNCLDCGNSILYLTFKNNGRPSQRCKSCNDAHYQVLKKSSRKLYKLKRRYQINGNSFDPNSVFNRDEWKCKLCGVDTPHELRGVNLDNSPELDHIIPLSKGGEHSLENTQCLCRRCNGLKSDIILTNNLDIFKRAA